MLQFVDARKKQKENIYLEKKAMNLLSNSTSHRKKLTKKGKVIQVENT